MTVIDVIQIEALGWPSSHFTTGISGSGRINAETTLVSRSIIPRNPAPAAECRAALEFPRLASDLRRGIGRQSPFRVPYGLCPRFSSRRAEFRGLLLPCCGHGAWRGAAA